MNCLNPTYILSPETKWLMKCKKENRSFEYYYHHANARRNLLLDPVPLVNEPYEYYDLHLNKRQQKVPCGKCDNCIKRKVNDYYVRCHYQFIETAVTGTSYMCCMTFAEEHLPRLEDGTPCFDSEIIKRFIKRLRQYFLRKLNYTIPLTYFIVSEYGGEFGRPHHHMILFLPQWQNTIANTFLVKEAIAYSWTKTEDRRDWYANDELDLFDLQRVDAVPIDSTRGIRYVCKYIGKQIGSTDFDKLDIEYRWKRNHWQSIGLGTCISKYVDSDQFRKGFVTIDGFKYSLPLYYSLKLKREFYCYADNGSIIYQPTIFARDSSRYFTMEKLQEYKDLSCLNLDFPKCPDVLYDAYNLQLLDEWLSNYNGFDLQCDFSAVDPVRHSDIYHLVDLIQDYFDKVDQWYKPKYLAQANQWRKHQNDYYNKKTGRK